MVIEDFEEGRSRKHDIGPDVLEEVQAVFDLPEDEEVDQWRAYFDPEHFIAENQPLTLDRFRLTTPELKTWAERMTKIRADITAKASRLKQHEPVEHNEVEEPRSRKGYKRSRPSHNSEGLTEQELKELRLVERVPCSRFKKRHLKDLDEEEIEDIVRETKQPGRLQKDIAILHRVSHYLVCKLVKEAESEPEKGRVRRLRKQLLVDKKDAVQEVTTNFLKAGVPIIRAQQVQLAVEE